MQRVKNLLESEFNTVPKLQGSILKTHVSSISGNQVYGLKDIYCMPEVKAMNIKRSGKGLTILVTLKS